MRNPAACLIKLCGLRRAEEVELAAELGVAAVGFVLSESPRRIGLEECVRLRERLPAGVRAQGVFAAESPEFINQAVAECRLDAAQVHGPEADEPYWAALRAPLIVRAFRVKGPRSLKLLEAVRGREFLLDAHVPGQTGGTGRSFDWDLARRAGEYGQVVLAGGLTPENVGEAIRRARPYMVDVSSGIEREKGVKSLDLMRAFVAAARRPTPEK